jgi:integrative and conjugative element protein (TIGR02256 family)
LEQLYYQSPYQFVVPHDFRDRLDAADQELIVDVRQATGQRRLTLVGRFAPAAPRSASAAEYSCMVLAMATIVHGAVEESPLSLGELQDLVERRSGSLIETLSEGIKRRCVSGNFPHSTAEKTLLVLSTPVKREIHLEPESVDITGFVVVANLADLGVAIGALDKTDTGYWSVPLLQGLRQQNQRWREYQTVQVEVVSAFTAELGRRLNGIPDDGPKGVLAGAGALGTEIFDLWTRAGWGAWTLIDPDQIRPHNLARHHALDCHVGFNKVDGAKSFADALIPGQASRARAIADYATNLTNAEVKSSLDEAELIVDATTTLEFPRDLSANSKVRRAVSVFVTPSGRGAVMLLEDKNRAIRLDCLEAQYYRQVISAPWGADHLAGSAGHFWTGAGCRDVSAVIPNELIGIHGANLAGMIRRRAAREQPSLLVWRYDIDAGSLSLDEHVPATPIVTGLSDFEIVWDHEGREKVRALRAAHLPNETGGVLLGYFDRVLKRVFIVDALEAPPDSKEENDGFIRGTKGLVDAIKEASERTAHIVKYVGEWHSHPPRASATPSVDDLLLLRHLAEALTNDGQPALMMIVGEDDESWLMAGESHKVLEVD